MTELRAPDPSAIERYKLVVIAGHESDVLTVRTYASDSAPIVRQAVLSALVRLGKCSADDIIESFNDPSPQVRARAAELAVSIDGIDPSSLLDDPEAAVVEVACFACGESQWSDTHPPIEQLSSIATSHDQALCRESGAAALGAIGHPDGLEAVLIACTDQVTVRRRATLALAAFDDQRAEAALRVALDDKDWQVRQAAEDLG